MRSTTFEKRIRRGEIFHSTKVPAGLHTIVRVDGRAFSGVTQRLQMQKPFDRKFHGSMQKAMGILLEKLNGVYGYTQSDEISILLPLKWDQFGRSVDEITSITASIASVRFAMDWDAPEAHFDSRIWTGSSEEDVVDYFRWRQADAIRNALNGWCFWMLKKGHTGSAKQIADMLRSVTFNQKLDLLSSVAIDFYDTEIWQRNGSHAYFEPYIKMGLNPKYGKEVPGSRRRITTENVQFTGSSFGTFIKEIMKCHTSKIKTD